MMFNCYKSSIGADACIAVSYETHILACIETIVGVLGSSTSSTSYITISVHNVC